jgi:4-diphosphocytidyl-2-C-methyl-D-erythritol kinase
MTPTEAASSTEPAPAKLNLCLHVTGQRADGYHLLDSLVAFTEVGDRVTVTPAARLTLSLDGPFAAGLPSEAENLVLRAARVLDPDRGAHVHLHKALPVAAGIGGGSSDAAATLRALSRLWDMPLPDTTRLLALGADVPACLYPGLLRMGGIGQDLTRLGDLPSLPLLLVNPGVALSTPQVFGGLAQKTNPPMDAPMPPPADTGTWLAWLARQRNDLTAPAIAAQPVIGTVLEALAARPGARLARMSGSGATCFAVFAQVAQRDAAADSLRAAHPDWWIVPTHLRSD